MRKQTSTNRQAGIVSIMVTLVLMLVITLIVVGFAQIARRTQRGTLDQQLSLQAFYAAESGVNDATSILHKYIVDNGTVPPSKTKCGVDTDPYDSLDGTLSSSSSVSYPCLLIATTTKDLVYNNLGPDDTNQQVIPIHGRNDDSTPANIKKIHIQWKPGVSGGSLDNCPTAADTNKVPTDWKDSNCPYGVLRYDLVPVPTDTGPLTRDDLMNLESTAFLYPTKSGGSTSVEAYNASGAANQGASTMATCTATECSIDIVDDSSNLFSDYSMRIGMLYQSTGTLTISAIGDDGTTHVALSGAQAIIDATGKAQDVLRRIQVRAPLTASQSQPTYSDYAIETTNSICKRYSVAPNLFTIPSDITSDSNSQLCNPLPPPALCTIPGVPAGTLASDTTTCKYCSVGGAPDNIWYQDPACKPPVGQCKFDPSILSTDPGCFCQIPGKTNLSAKDPACSTPTDCVQSNKTVGINFNRIGYGYWSNLLSGFQTTQAVSIPAGCYYLSLYSTDDHHWGNNNAGSEFQHEQWHVTFYDKNNKVLFTSNDVADLPDHCLTGYQTVNGPVNFSADVAKIIVDHIGDQPGDQPQHHDLPYKPPLVKSKYDANYPTAAEYTDYTQGKLDDNSLVPQKIAFTKTQLSAGFKCTTAAPATKPN
jgi:Tfp pilus assembly protein PilX